MPSDDDGDESLREQIKEASTAAFQRIEASAPPSVAARLRRCREALRRNRGLDTAWRVLVFAGALAFCEWLRGHVLTGFPWNPAGAGWAAGSAPSARAMSTREMAS